MPRVADAVAIVSVVSGATVAITVPLISSVLERQRLRWQDNQARLDELRGIVDTTLGQMARVADLIFDVQQETSTPTAKMPVRLAEISAGLTEAYAAIKAHGLQIGLRLGPKDDIAAAHNAIELIVADVEAIVAGELRPGGVLNRFSHLNRLSEKGKRELWERLTKVRSHLGESWSNLGSAVGDFQGRVADLIGPIREPRRSVLPRRAS
jgi:hypothetical protein